MNPPTRDRFEVLVTAASKHGITAEISQLVAETLSVEGIATTLMPIQRVVSINEYDGVVVGSAIYDGRWLEPAREFVKSHCPELKNRMVWMFSAGPQADLDAAGAGELRHFRRLVKPLDYKVFVAGVASGGRHLGPLETHRSTSSGWDPDEVRRWALGVGGAVSVVARGG